MRSLKETILEGLVDINEAKAGRAWSGKLQNIDNLLSWMYSKDILNKTDKKAKDTLFRSYYRYYNDGDFPKSLSSKGVYKGMPNSVIENALEEKLEEFIKKILSKYAGKYNRSEFSYDQALNSIQNNISVLKHNDAYAFINYWEKEVPKEHKTDKYLNLFSSISKNYVEFKAAKEKALASYDGENKNSWDGPRDNLTVSATIERFTKYGIYSDEMKKAYDNLQKSMSDMIDFLEDIKTSINKMKDLLK